MFGPAPRLSSATRGQKDFSRLPAPDIQRSSFNRTCGYKTTLDAGYLIPFFCDHALPGDTMTMNVTTVGRLSTLLSPIMDNVKVSTFFFAVPMRILWDNWHKFMGAQDNPGDSTDFEIPTITAHATNGWTTSSIGDYFGIPTNIASLEHSAMPFRAYNLIWNEWFRSQDLQNSVTINKDDGPDAETDYVLLKRGKRHDYFTSCLPWPQKGDAVDLPLGTQAPLVWPGHINPVASGTGIPKFTIDGATNRSLQGAGGNNNTEWSQTSNNADAAWDNPELRVLQGDLQQGYADLQNATAATINELRQAFQIQRMFERDARSGTRLPEVLRAHFGVISPDFRMQRPEYLGGNTTRLSINPIPGTNNNASNTFGDLSAQGTFVGNGGMWRQSFTEHSLIIGLVCVHADLNYQQGLERHWSYTTKFDFYWPSLAHLGEQEVKNKELYADGSANDELTFGYQERYAEYRYKPNLVTGKMRSNASGTLEHWHLAQDFASLPTLGDTFIKEDPPMARILAVQTEPHVLMDCHFEYHCARPMPVYSVPGLIDHF